MTCRTYTGVTNSINDSSVTFCSRLVIPVSQNTQHHGSGSNYIKGMLTLVIKFFPPGFDESKSLL